MFTLTFWLAMCYHLKVQRWLSTTFHLQTDGQMEWQNLTLEQFLQAYVTYQQNHWVEWLPLAEFAYNNSWQLTTGESLFYLLMGHNPHLDKDITDIPDYSPKVPMVNNQLGSLLQV